jgi:hypothetical protein
MDLLTPHVLAAVLGGESVGQRRGRWAPNYRLRLERAVLIRGKTNREVVISGVLSLLNTQIASSLQTRPAPHTILL